MSRTTRSGTLGALEEYRVKCKEYRLKCEEYRLKFYDRDQTLADHKKALVDLNMTLRKKEEQIDLLNSQVVTAKNTHGRRHPHSSRSRSRSRSRSSGSSRRSSRHRSRSRSRNRSRRRSRSRTSDRRNDRTSDRRYDSGDSGGYTQGSGYDNKLRLAECDVTRNPSGRKMWRTNKGNIITDAMRLSFVAGRNPNGGTAPCNPGMCCGFACQYHH